MFSSVPKGTSLILIVNISIYFIQVSLFPSLSNFFVLKSDLVIYKFEIWRLFTYMFFHGSFLHLFFNMYVLWWVGSELERYWGKIYFNYFYFISGVIAGLIILLFDYFTSLLSPFGVLGYSVTLGASGAIMACFFAFGIMNPNLRVLFFFIFPMSIRKVVLFSVVFSVVGLLIQTVELYVYGMGSSNISHAGHLGGVVGATVLIILMRNKSYELMSTYNDLRDEFSLFLVTMRLRSDSNSWSTRESFFKRLFKRGAKKKKLDDGSMSEYEIEETIDRLLKKISEKGLKKLSEEEKKFLEKMSGKYNHKFPDQ